MIKGDEKNRGKWKIGIIENIFMGKDNTIRSSEYVPGRTLLKKPIQLLYPMELHCDSKLTTSNTQDNKALNVNVEFRPKRSAAAVAEQRIRDIADNENQ